ncbi:MAG TPA: TlpA disulfide reductase family protein [Anaerolineae bacterium]|nr:TlpA disulfide reductase family protein [Anaerolineae bacterium]
MNRNVKLWILFLSGVGLIALGAIALWALVVIQPLNWLVQAQRERPTFDASPFPTAIIQTDPNAIGWSVGSLAPEIELKDLKEETVRLSDFRGRPVLVNFWATWYGPCRIEMPIVEQKYRKYKETEKFVILAINIQDDAGVDAVRSFLGELSLTFPVLLDKDGIAETAYHVLGLPTSFFIDRRGIIRATRVGNMSEQYIDEQLQKIFAEE